MAAWGFDNNAQNQTPTGSPMTNSQLTIPLVSSSAFAALAAGLKTVVMVQDTGPLGAGPSAFEFMLCTGNNTGTNTLTVDPAGRGFGGTTAKAFAGGATVTQIVSKEVLTGAFARLDTALSQTLTGPLVIPPSLGGSPATTSYGSLPIKIDEQVLASGSASAAITVPTWATMIETEWEILTNSGNVTDVAAVQFNGDTGTTYTAWRSVLGSAYSSTGRATGQNSIVIGSVPGTGTEPANGTTKIHFPRETGHVRKVLSTSARGDSTNEPAPELTGGTWTNTANAIATIVYLISAGTFVSSRIVTKAHP